MVLFIHNIKKIKDAAYKNGDINSTCNRAFKVCLHVPFLVRARCYHR